MVVGKTGEAWSEGGRRDCHWIKDGLQRRGWEESQGRIRKALRRETEQHQTTSLTVGGTTQDDGETWQERGGDYCYWIQDGLQRDGWEASERLIGKALNGSIIMSFAVRGECKLVGGGSCTCDSVQNHEWYHHHLWWSQISFLYTYSSFFVFYSLAIASFLIWAVTE